MPPPQGVQQQRLEDCAAQDHAALPGLDFVNALGLMPIQRELPLQLWIVDEPELASRPWRPCVAWRGWRTEVSKDVFPKIPPQIRLRRDLVHVHRDADGPFPMGEGASPAPPMAQPKELAQEP
jgi:hypothetical protein